MSLADRIAKIEAKLLASAPAGAPPVVPAILITTPHEDDDDSQPYRVEHAGSTWTQQDGETTTELLHRAHADILERPVADRGLPDGPFPVLLLVAQRKNQSRAPDGKDGPEGEGTP